MVGKLSFRLLVSVALLISALGSGVHASTPESCLKAAAQHHKVDYMLLRAIAQVESGLNPTAVGRNTNGTSDRGLMQINDWWLPKLANFGISKQSLMDPCVSAFVGAWILSHEISRHGSTWKAVGAYNSPTPKHQLIYVARVQKRLAELLLDR